MATRNSVAPSTQRAFNILSGSCGRDEVIRQRIGRTMSGGIFVSFASADQRYAERIISVLERHDFPCWVSYRDVGVGENYQESITRALRSAEALMVIISRSANLSTEIPKELSLASR